MDGLLNAYNSIGDFLSTPFDNQVSTTQWLLIGGLVVVIAGAWIMILRDLKGAIE